MREMRDDFYDKDQIKLIMDLALKANETPDYDASNFMERKMFEAFKIGRLFQERFYARDMEEIAEKAFPNNPNTKE